MRCLRCGGPSDGYEYCQFCEPVIRAEEEADERIREQAAWEEEQMRQEQEERQREAELQAAYDAEEGPR